MTHIIQTEKMIYGGDCITKINGKNIFVPYACPGEKLEVEITEDKRDYGRARIVNIIEKSPDRIEPVCSLYTKCGGCNMQHIDYEAQTKMRMDVLKSAFEREGVKIPEIKAIKGNPLNYRNRFQFHNGGLMEKMSNNVLDLKNCPCAVKEINDYLEHTPMCKRPYGRVHVFASDKIQGDQKIVIAREKEKEIEKPVKVKGKKKAIKRYTGTNYNEENSLTLKIKDKNITFNVQGFFQSNLEVLEMTIDAVVKGLEGTNVLDMYAGCGTFSVFLAQKFKNVILVEHNRDALVYAEQNLTGIKHASFGISGEKWVTEHADNCIRQYGPIDAVVIDPPRSGMEKKVCQWLCSSGIREIRSISCDTATQARDIKFLTRSGYIVKELYLLDFYPQTGHIESLAILEREKPLEE